MISFPSLLSVTVLSDVMNELLEMISGCEGSEKKDCWGCAMKDAGHSMFSKPTVVKCFGRPKTMVITEQPNVSPKKIAELGKDWNPSRLFIDEFNKELQARHPFFRKMDKIFSGRLSSDFDRNSQAFHSIYWTHFVKCSGQLRYWKEYTVKNKPRFNACADKFLFDELRTLRPELIVAVGGLAATWILKKVSDERLRSLNWREIIWKELEQVILKKKEPLEIEMDDLKFRLFVAFHPSGNNSVGIWINDKLKELVRESLPVH